MAGACFPFSDPIDDNGNVALRSTKYPIDNGNSLGFRSTKCPFDDGNLGFRSTEYAIGDVRRISYSPPTLGRHADEAATPTGRLDDGQD